MPEVSDKERGATDWWDTKAGAHAMEEGVFDRGVLWIIDDQSSWSKRAVWASSNEKPCMRQPRLARVPVEP